MAVDTGVDDWVIEKDGIIFYRGNAANVMAMLKSTFDQCVKPNTEIRLVVKHASSVVAEDNIKLVTVDGKTE